LGSLDRPKASAVGGGFWELCRFCETLLLLNTYFIKKEEALMQKKSLALAIPLGVSFGLLFGMVLKNAALGISMGILFAVIFSQVKGLDKKDDEE
jgi:hypothetical protein